MNQNFYKVTMIIENNYIFIYYRILSNDNDTVII